MSYASSYFGYPIPSSTGSGAISVEYDVRVSPAELKGIKPTTITDLMPYIISANMIVSDINAKCGKSFDEARLKQIELNLAAHFMSSIDPSIFREKFENAENYYQVGNQNLSGVLSDTFGQIANMLSEGCLIEDDKRNTQMVFI